MNDFRRDWRRWTRTERIGAVVILALAVFLPTLLALSAHSPPF